MCKFLHIINDSNKSNNRQISSYSIKKNTNSVVPWYEMFNDKI